MKLTGYSGYYGNAKITYTVELCNIMGVFTDELG